MRPLLIGIAAGLVVAAALAPAAGGSLSRLAQARAERARLAAMIAGPALARAIVVPGLGRAARTQADADAALAGQLRAAAIRGNVLIEALAPAGAGGLARVQLRVSGSEDAVIAFADGIERGRPLARFAGWSVAADGGGVRLTAEVVAPWG